jgi:hypothetical protein
MPRGKKQRRPESSGLAIGDHGAGNFYQLNEIDGLCEIGNLLTGKKHFVERAGGGAENNDGQVGKLIAGTDVHESGFSIHARHVDIKNNQAGEGASLFHLFQLCNAFLAVMSFEYDDAIVDLLNRIAKQLQVIGIVVDAKDRALIYFVQVHRFSFQDQQDETGMS